MTWLLVQEGCRGVLADPQGVGSGAAEMLGLGEFWGVEAVFKVDGCLATGSGFRFERSISSLRDLGSLGCLPLVSFVSSQSHSNRIKLFNTTAIIILCMISFLCILYIYFFFVLLLLLLSLWLLWIITITFFHYIFIIVLINYICKTGSFAAWSSRVLSSLDAARWAMRCSQTGLFYGLVGSWEKGKLGLCFGLVASFFWFRKSYGSYEEFSSLDGRKVDSGGITTRNKPAKSSAWLVRRKTELGKEGDSLHQH